MKPLQVEAPGGSYPIFLGNGAVRGIPAWIRKRGGCSSAVIISDAAVFPLHGKALREDLESAGLRARAIIVPAGERSKSCRQMESIWRRAVQAGIDRKTWILALGGGVVGDLAGFAAATILRGVPFIQIPTSLLAMVDSSVGGKTGINLPEGKNLVGAFYQPRAVFIDLDFLGTLPQRERTAGWAEIIKAAAIADAGLFREIERHSGSLRRGGGARLAGIIRRACRIKADVVRADEKEQGPRMVLNFGHTLGHGIEAAAGYQGLIHGEAVAIGMAFAARLGAALGYTSADAAGRIEKLLKRMGLPVRLPGKYTAPLSRVYAAMKKDKKAGSKGLRWVLVPEIGSARIVDSISWPGAQAAIKNFLKE